MDIVIECELDGGVSVPVFRLQRKLVPVAKVLVRDVRVFTLGTFLQLYSPNTTWDGQLAFFVTNLLHING